MEVLKPDLYWIGNRCYRVNPCQNNHAQFYSVPNDDDEGTGIASSKTAPPPLKPYVEADEYEGKSLPIITYKSPPCQSP